jgi:hypothetical protein
MRVKTASGVLLFALIAAVFVHGQSQEIRMSGVYSAVAGDSAETASKIAALDARRKVIQQTATQLGALPAVKGMNLSEETLGALAFGLVDIEVQPPTSTPPAYRAQAAARLDSLEALARLRALRRDVEVTNELRRLSRDQNGDWEKLAGLSAADRARAARRLEARQSVARSAVLSVADRGFMAPTQEIREARVRARKLAEEARALDPESPAARYRLGDLLML